jgi:ABC-type multidrug transport system fused ATPase/permease subunit
MTRGAASDSRPSTSGRNRASALWVVIPFLLECRPLLVRFALSTLGRAGLLLGSVILIREFLAAVLGEGAGLATALAGVLDPSAALWVIAGLLVVSFLGASVLNYDNHIVQQRIIRGIELGLMARLVRHLMTLSVAFFDRQSEGDLLQAIRRDVTNLRIVVLSAGTVILESVVALSLAGAAVYLSPVLALWVLLVLPVAGLPILWAARRARERSHTVRRTGYVLFDVILQILKGIRTLRVYRAEPREAESATRHASRYFEELLHAVRLAAFAQMSLEALSGFSVVAVVLLGGYQVMEGAMTWADLMAFLVAVRAVHGPLNSVSRGYMEMQSGAASVQRINALLQERPSVREAPVPLALARPPRWIRFEGVGMDFGDGPVLEGLEFGVQGGETVGIVGPSGAGKSTLLGLIARFHDPSEGRIRFDDHDLRALRLADLYDHLAMVGQEPFLFSATVKENIRLGRPEATDEAVREAAAAACIDREIMELPAGYDTLVGLAGHPLSRGQAQRICIARAVLKNPSILLLDEPTSSLDPIAERRVEDAVARIMRGRTTFAVAHRLSTVRDASRIIVLDRGHCVAMGRHDELLAECSLYRCMWESQRNDAHGQAPLPKLSGTPVAPG